MTKATFELETTEGQVKKFNAQNGASISLKNLPAETTLSIVDILQYEDKTDTYGKDQDVTVTVLFGEDGQLYGAVSETIAQAAAKLIDFMQATQTPSVNLKITKQSSKAGNEFLSLQIV